MEEKTRVLIADSDKDFCTCMVEAIADSNDMELVGIVDDGAKALAAVNELRPGLFIIDPALPVMDGMIVLEHLREKEPKVPTVVLSAFVSPQTGAECAVLGVDLFMRKPMQADTVLERIRMWKAGKERAARINDTIALEVLVTDVIHQVGVPAHIKGTSIFEKLSSWPSKT